MAHAIRSDLMHHRQLDPATGVRTTRFCRTRRAPFVLRAVNRSWVQPTLRPHLRASALASTASRPAFVTTRDPPLLPGRDSAEIATDLGVMESDLYLRSELDDPNQIESVQQIRFSAYGFFAAMAKSEVHCCRDL